MAAGDFELADPPSRPQFRELWLQHAAGFILFKGMREYARDRIDPSLSPEAREGALKAIDDAIYGLMMVIEGVEPTLRNVDHEVDVRCVVRFAQSTGNHYHVIQELDLREGDGVCMGFHQWKEGDFGEDPVAIPRKLGS